VTLTIGEDERGAIGFALARAVSDEAELLLIAVDPERQGGGAGSAMLQDFIASARAGGARRLHLEVRDGNPAVDLGPREGEPAYTLGRRYWFAH
jgi:ribosomal-protein-alanine N-acetyltransferase